MTIAVTTENNQIFQHFGRCPQFTLYDVDGGQILRKSLLSVQGSGHSALAGLLSQNGVNILICGGIGLGAKQMLDETGIKVASGVTGKADDAVKSYLLGTLPVSDVANCDHNHDEHGGEHHCTCNCD